MVLRANLDGKNDETCCTVVRFRGSGLLAVQRLLDLHLGANWDALGANLDALGANLDALGAKLGVLRASLDALGYLLGNTAELVGSVGRPLDWH